MKLFRATIRKEKRKDQERYVYVVAHKMTDAASVLSENLAIEEELMEMVCLEGDCYVQKVR